MPRWEVPYESPDRTLSRHVLATIFTLACPLPLCALAVNGTTAPAAWVVVPLMIAAFITVTWRIVLDRKSVV